MLTRRRIWKLEKRNLGVVFLSGAPRGFSGADDHLHDHSE
jgi:hypothetical protein